MTLSSLPPLSPMRNPIRDYDWGSDSALARLQSRIPSGGPEAELWMGAHPAAPSSLVVPADVAADGVLPLPDAIAGDPEDVLGADAVSRFGARLPFILKILAIAKPLSVQVHPDADRAKAVHRPGGGSPYVDAFHKPEMLYALEPTEALFGFRPAGQSVAMLEHLRCERLSDVVSVLQGDDGNEAARLHAGLELLLRWPVEDRMTLVADIASAVSRLQSEGNPDYADAFAWVGRLVGLHPADPMVLAPLLLDLVKLAPGDSKFVPAGVPHCYLDGLGVEILAASDNVLRSGLTSKAVDIEELLQVIDTRPLAAASAVVSELSEYETRWQMPVDDFQLTRIRVPAGGAAAADATIGGPQVVLCTAGQVRVMSSGTAVELTPGTSAFATAQAGPLQFATTGDADGEIFRAAIG